MFRKMLRVRMLLNKKRHFSSSFDDKMAEIERKTTLHRIYYPAFKNLNPDEQSALALSGDVWWKYSNIENRDALLSMQTISSLKAIDASASALVGHNPFADANSPVWVAFRLAMTHHSTAIEGNKLNIGNTEKMLDEFGDGISRCIGITESSTIDPLLLQGLDVHDVVEVVNHAAAMEFTKKYLFGQLITVSAIQELFNVLNPPSSINFTGRGRFSPLHGNFRQIPIKVRGSPTVRPYAHEIPALIHKILDLYHNKHLHDFHPVVAEIFLMMNFLYVHPFHDGNGRISRLLLQTSLYNHGFLGFILPVKEKQLFLSHFTPYFENNSVNGMVAYFVHRIAFFHENMKAYELDGVVPDFVNHFD